MEDRYITYLSRFIHWHCDSSHVYGENVCVAANSNLCVEPIHLRARRILLVSRHTLRGDALDNEYVIVVLLSATGCNRETLDPRNWRSRQAVSSYKIDDIAGCRNVDDASG